jgi:glycine/D-amino acid oxidase-like deaminating enzyme
VVVGGGIAGASAALHLAKRGYSVALLEARFVGYGASGRSGGQTIFGLAAGQRLSPPKSARVMPAACSTCRSRRSTAPRN